MKIKKIFDTRPSMIRRLILTAIILFSSLLVGAFHVNDVGIALADNNFTALPGSPNNIKTFASPMGNGAIIYAGGRFGFSRSLDGGTTWQDANSNLPYSSGQVYTLAIDPSNAQVIYAGLYGGGVYRSADGGTTWQAANAGLQNAKMSSVRLMQDGNLFADTIGTPGNPGGVYHSIDQGASWQRIGDGPSGEARGSLAVDPTPMNAQHLFEAAVDGVRFSADGGGTWRLIEPNPGNGSFTTLAFLAPGKIIAGGYNALALSTDNGLSWTSVQEGVTGYSGAPFSVVQLVFNPKDSSALALIDGDIYRLKAGVTSWERITDITDYTHIYVGIGVGGDGSIYASTGGQGLFRYGTPPLPTAPETKPVPLPDGTVYFEATQHTLGGVFYQYWQKYGGLAQFGYPLTRVFSELNPADNKTYSVQYFERARFEYHPEFTNSPYVVELGLLGVQQTSNRVFDPAIAIGGSTRYFPETRHNLGGAFRKYWENNGGLFVYGLPISEEFNEVSPTDGKTYIVQYFERNRFEYHPEFSGTKYEVLLGLLGVQTLRQRGWIS